MVLPSGELHIRDVGPEDGYKTYQCRTKHRLTGETRLSATKGRLVITGKSKCKSVSFLLYGNHDSDSAPLSLKTFLDHPSIYAEGYSFTSSTSRIYFSKEIRIVFLVSDLDTTVYTFNFAD